MISEPFLALFAALFGGAGLKIIEHFLNRRGRKQTLQSELRDELRTDLENLRALLSKVTSERDTLKEETFDLNHRLNMAILDLANGRSVMKDVLDEVSSETGLEDDTFKRAWEWYNGDK